MLILNLPKGELEGTCRINGEQCEFRIEGDFLSFREKGVEAWDRRKILQANDGGKIVNYVCGNGADEPAGPPPMMFTDAPPYRRPDTN